MILATSRFLACVLWLFLSGRRRVCMGWGSYEPRRIHHQQQHRNEQRSRHLFQNGRRPPSLSAPWTTRLYVHCVVASPLCTNSSSSSSSSSPVMAPIDSAINDNGSRLDQSLNDRIDNQLLSKLYQSMRQVNGKQDDDSCLLQFHTTKDGIRGLHVTRLVREGETVLAVPLDPRRRSRPAPAPAHASQSASSSWFGCLVDRRPPVWLPTHVQEDSKKWATRLAASWLDLYLQGRQEKRQQQSSSVPSNDDDDAFAQWLTLLPERERLRATLPVHWSEETLRNAKCTSLELAVDSAFFTRAEAIEDLMEGLKASPYTDNVSGESDGLCDSASLNHLCEYALDLVQTRSCRVESATEEDVTGISYNGRDQVQSTYVRVLAPVFDFINHGGQKAANAYFELERRHQTTNRDDENCDLVTPSDFLAVKALRDIDSGMELLIDYGTSATWPSWKCLFSYGFIPHYEDTGDSEKEGADENENELNDEAEVYVAGIRYEVSADTIPVEMVATATCYSEPPLEDSKVDVELSPEIATRLANRISMAAYNLLLEADDNFDELNDKPSLLVANQLAASLRWSQHCVLLACAEGLSKYAKHSLDKTTG